MKIAMVTPYLPPRLGGREFWVIHMSQELQNLGHEVMIFSTNVQDFHKSSSKAVQSEIKGIPVYKASTPVDISRLSTPLCIPPFKKLKSFNPDIVHIHEPNIFLNTPLSIYAKYFLKKKIIMHNYSDPFDWHGGSILFKIAMKFYSLLHRFKLHISDNIFIISKEYMEYARYFHPYHHKIEIIPMCLSSNFYEKNKNFKEDRTILYAGRLDRRKGIDLLIRAMKVVPSSKCIIVGNGDKSTTAELMQEAEKVMKDNDGVEILFEGKKSQTELNDYLNRSTLLVLPTIDVTAETFGAVLIEAWATGTPVISADNPAPSFLVKGSGGGLTFNRGDEIELADKINYLLDHPEERIQMAMNGKNYVKDQFSFAVNAKKLDRIYSKLLN